MFRRRKAREPGSKTLALPACGKVDAMIRKRGEPKPPKIKKSRAVKGSSESTQDSVYNNKTLIVNYNEGYGNNRMDTVDYFVRV
jgi:hypothetical protein